MNNQNRPTFDTAETATHNQSLQDAESRYRAERRRASRAEHTAAMWRHIAYAAAIGIIAIEIAAILAVSAAGIDEAPDVELPAEKPTVEILDDTYDRPENELIEAALLERANVIEDCTVTHYDCCVACCGKTDGITASGVQATPGVTVAVDPDVIPLGSDVLVDYGDGDIHYYRADDVGGAIKGNHIDLCVNSHEEALMLGRRTATVYWVEED